MNPLDPNTPVGTVPPPSTIGPLTAKLNQNVVKVRLIVNRTPTWYALTSCVNLLIFTIFHSSLERYGRCASHNKQQEKYHLISFRYLQMTDFFRTLLEDCIEKLEEPVTQLTMLKLQLEQSNWRYQQQIEEIKHNYGMDPGAFICILFTLLVCDGVLSNRLEASFLKRRVYSACFLRCLLNYYLENIYIYDN